MEELLKKLGLPDASGKLSVARNIDISKMALSPEEGFLLSRIDVTNSLVELLQISTFPQNQTIQMLTRFVDQGLIEAKGQSKTTSYVVKPATKPASSRQRKPREETGDLEPEFCLEIEDRYDQMQKAGLTAAQILGVAEKAGAADVKKAYLTLTKKFHPDRLFRKQAGSYRKWLEFVFLQLNKAYQEITAASEKPIAPPEKKQKSAPEAKKNPFTERLKQAKRLIEEAKVQSAREPVSALNSLRLAQSFDPRNPEIKKMIEELEPRAQLRKSIPLFQKTQEFEDILAFPQAAEAYEQAALGDPNNAKFQRTCGEFLLYKMKQPAKALAFAQRALELEPNTVDGLMLYGGTLKGTQQYAEALGVFEKVLHLDKTNLFAKNEIAELKKNLIISGKKR